MSKVLILLSGGVDSTTCLAKAIEKHGKSNVISLAISYGQKHMKELESAKKIAKFYDVEFNVLDFCNVFSDSNSTLLNNRENLPQGTYSQQLETSSLLSTYVPFRNGFFISAAASFALSKDCDEVWYGAHSDDSAQNAYPDCSVEFVEAMKQAVHLGSGKALKLVAPFVTLEKKDVVREGLRLNVPFELTWSCYAGQQLPCRKCGTCRDRESAFSACGTTDPLLKDL